jgi:hypothetical protein
MKILKISLQAAVICASLTSCTRNLDIIVQFSGKNPEFIFSIDSIISRDGEIPCVWRFEIVDRKSDRVILTRLNKDRCLRTKSLQIIQPIAGLSGKGDFTDLVRGREYRADALADGASGQSKPWTAR